MDLGAGELQDWELLHKSDESSPINSPKSVDSTKGFEVNNIIRSNYFSFDSLNKYLPNQETYETESEFGEFDDKGQLGVVEKDKIQVGFGRIGEIVDESENIEVGVGHVSLGSKFGEFDGKGQLGGVEKDKIQVGFGGIGEIVDESENIEVGVGHVSLGIKFGEFDGKGQLGGVENDKIQVGFGGIGEIVDESENIEVGVGDHVSSDDCKFDCKDELGVVENDEIEVGFGVIGEIAAAREKSEMGFDGIGEIIAEEGSVRSDNPSCIDPGLEIQYSIKRSVLSDDCKFGEFNGKNQLGVVENDKMQVGFGGVRETVGESEKSEIGVGDRVNLQDGLASRYSVKVSGEFQSDTGSNQSVDCKFGEFDGKDPVSVVENNQIQVGFGGIGEILAEEGSVRSDDPSWIEPRVETQYPIKEFGEYICDSSSDRSDEREYDAKNHFSIVEDDKIGANFDGTEEIVAESEDSGKIWSDSSGTESVPVKLGDNSVRVGDDENLREEMEFSGDEKVEDGKKPSGNEIVSVEAKSGGGEEKRSMVWWKFPLEFLKYCVFRVSPVWTISVAAAVMGFAILGRRLYMMKRKSRSLQINVTVDDKKVSQVMSRVARLNEAFSIVRRVPMVRPSLPAAGVTPWPITSLR